VRVALPGFERVMVCAAEVVPVVLVKVSAVGDRTAWAAVPVPLRVAVCGEPVTLSATLMAAEKVVAVPGVKVTEIAQLPSEASDVPQLLVSAKLLAPVPVMEIPVMVRAAVPGFESVMVCTAVVTPAGLVKVRLVGARTACGVGAAVPVPVSVAVCGEPVAVSATAMDAEKVVAEAGVNVTEMVQVAEAASVVPQLLVSAKSVGLLPVIDMPEMARLALPGFESVMVCAADVVPVVLAKLSAVGDRTA